MCSREQKKLYFDHKLFSFLERKKKNDPLTKGNQLQVVIKTYAMRTKSKKK